MEEEEEELKALIIRVAEAHAEIYGPDGDSYGFTSANYPEGHAGFGPTPFDAAVAFLKEIY